MPPHNEEFLEVQHHVFEDEIRKNHAENDELRFIAEHSLPFRLFAERMTPELRKVWDNYAAGDNTALPFLEEAYETFKADLVAHIEAEDPEAATALVTAIEEGDINMVTQIINAHARIPEVEAA